MSSTTSATTTKVVTNKFQKALHSSVEKKRRQRVNVLIDRLGDLLPPTLRLASARNRTKSLEVLHEYVLELKSKFDALMFANPQNVYVSEILILKRQLVEMEKVLTNAKMLLHKLGIPEKVITSDRANLDEVMKRLENRGKKKPLSSCGSSSDEEESSEDAEEGEDIVPTSATSMQPKVNSVSTQPMFLNAQPPTTFLLINNQLVATTNVAVQQPSTNLFSQFSSSNLIQSQLACSSSILSSKLAKKSKKKKKKRSKNRVDKDICQTSPPKTTTGDGKQSLETIIERISTPEGLQETVKVIEVSNDLGISTQESSKESQSNSSKSQTEEETLSSAKSKLSEVTITTIITPSKSKSSYSAESLLQPKPIELPAPQPTLPNSSTTRANVEDAGEQHRAKSNTATTSTLETNEQSTADIGSVTSPFNLQNFSYLLKPLTGGGEDVIDDGSGAHVTSASAAAAVAQYFSDGTSAFQSSEVSTSATSVSYGSQFLATSASFDPTAVVFTSPAAAHHRFNANFMPDFGGASTSFSLPGSENEEALPPPPMSIMNCSTSKGRTSSGAKSTTTSTTSRVSNKSKSTTITSSSGNKKSTTATSGGSSGGSRKKKETPSTTLDTRFTSAIRSSSEVQFPSSVGGGGGANRGGHNRNMIDNTNNSFLMTDIISPLPIMNNTGGSATAASIPSSYSTFATFPPPTNPSTPTSHHHYYPSAAAMTNTNSSSHFTSNEQPAASSPSHYQNRYQNLFPSDQLVGGNAQGISYQSNSHGGGAASSGSNRTYEFDHFLAESNVHHPPSSSSSGHHTTHHHQASLLSSFIPPPTATSAELASYPIFRPQPQTFPPPPTFHQSTRSSLTTLTSTTSSSASTITTSSTAGSARNYANTSSLYSSSSVPNFNLSNILDISGQSGPTIGEHPNHQAKNSSSYHNIARSSSSTTSGGSFLPKFSKFPVPASTSMDASNFYHQSTVVTNQSSMSTSNSNYPSSAVNQANYQANSHYFPYSQPTMNFGCGTIRGPNGGPAVTQTARSSRVNTSGPGGTSSGHLGYDETSLVPFSYAPPEMNHHGGSSTAGHYGNGATAGFHQNFHRGSGGGETSSMGAGQSSSAMSSSTSGSTTTSGPPPLAPFPILGRLNFNS